MKWILPVAVVVIMVLAVLDFVMGSSGPADQIAQAVGPYFLG